MIKKDVKIRISSSISNFKEKLLKRMECQEWDWFSNPKDTVIFFGAYHFGDWSRILYHKGQKKIFWTGGDILNLKKSFWKDIIPYIPAQHYCENEVEQLELANLKIKAKVLPMIFDDPDKIIPYYEKRLIPNVYLCSHPEYNEQYGVNLIEGLAATIPDVIFHIYGVQEKTHDNIRYHGKVSSERFDKEIRQYQAGLRLNDFDGFSEVLAKSVLLGQHPISRIPYPFIDHAVDMVSLINLLKSLKNKKKPNTKGRDYWYKKLCQNKNTLLLDWEKSDEH